METIRWGIIGTGRITRAVAKDFREVAGAELTAVASRTQQRADEWAREFGLEKAYGSYRSLLDDEDIDVVYIATPHPQHLDIALAAIERGKAVLVEKAMTATYAGTERLVEAARARGTFLMEAMWTRFQPAVQAAKEVIAWGRIGDVVAVQGDLVLYRDFDPTDRLFAPELGGGSLLDLGVYPVSIAQFFLGNVKDVRCLAREVGNGVDAAASISLRHEGNALSSLTCALDASGPSRCVILGTKGWIELEPPFHHPATVSVNRVGALPRVIETKVVGRGYAHQFAEVTRLVQQGATESSTMPLADSLEVMRILDECVTQAGITYEEATVDLG
ncbi:MAG: Gfo/Idh/MocA family oxidoreductase [Propionibacteriaceae bacterium]|nr:Gfo/Idh/MocA family oxidoreductase [Propionibacteriaceae bacterium]